MTCLTLEEAERAIGEPADHWVARCHEIAARLLKSGLVKGKLRYGHYNGPVRPGTFFDGKPIVRHGWIEQGATIIDPTRWVFEGVPPYIYIGPNEGEYDAGGNVFMAATLAPPPAFDERAKATPLSLSPECEAFLLGLLKHPRFTMQGLFWLANLPLPVLGEFARETFRALERAGETALIPIDNWQLVMEE